MNEQLEPAALIGAALTDIVRGDLQHYANADLQFMLGQLDAFIAEVEQVPMATVARQHAMLGTVAAQLVYDALTARVAARDALRDAGKPSQDGKDP